MGRRFQNQDTELSFLKQFRDQTKHNSDPSKITKYFGK